MVSFKLSTSHGNLPCLVSTLGPSSFGHVESLVAAGATAFRLNASHLSPDAVRLRCNEIRAIAPELPCVVDLQGNKMRIGELSARQLDAGEHVVLSHHVAEAAAVVVPHPELFAQVEVGEHLTLDDGRIQIRIVARESGRLVAEVERPGLLRPRKGINRLEHPLELEDLSSQDEATILRCLGVERVEFAFSFAADGREADWVRRRAPGRRVALKVERREAIEHLECLARAADELWICRGDLGAQLGLVDMARAIALLEPRRFSVPILMAGQVFEHLTYHDLPTRSEVCHLYDLVTRGYAGIVLSDETAIGVAPATAVQWAANLLNHAVQQT